MSTSPTSLRHFKYTINILLNDVAPQTDRGLLDLTLRLFPVPFPCEGGLLNRGWQQLAVLRMLISAAYKSPLMLLIWRTMGVRAYYGALFKDLTETDFASPLPNEVRVACWLYFIGECRAYRHNKLQKGDPYQSHISFS